MFSDYPDYEMSHRQGRPRSNSLWGRIVNNLSGRIEYDHYSDGSDSDTESDTLSQESIDIFDLIEKQGPRRRRSSAKKWFSSSQSMQQSSFSSSFRQKKPKEIIIDSTYEKCDLNQSAPCVLPTKKPAAKEPPIKEAPIVEELVTAEESATEEPKAEEPEAEEPEAEEPETEEPAKEEAPKVQRSDSFLKGAAENHALSQEAADRLDELRGLDDTRDGVDLWREKRYCHRVFRHRATTEYAQHTCLEVWEKPDQVSTSTTYFELHKHAQTVSAWVTAACAETTTKNRIVCVYLPRSMELMATVIGIWYSGAAVAVIDTKLPWQRLAFVAEDASAGLLVTIESLVGENPDEFPCPILNVKAALPDPNDANKKPKAWLGSLGPGEDADIPDPEQVSDENIDDEDACVVIYTSGSTGNPKGVQLQYKAFSNYACIEQRLTIPGPKDRIVQTQSLSFIAGFHECWRGLNSGATTVMANAAVTALGPDLEAWLRDREITMMKAVPSLLRSMMVGDRRPHLPKMRMLHIGGEAVTQDLVDCFGHGRLFLNTYGSTETCSNCIIGFCTPGDEQCTIGKALPSFKALILSSPDSNEEVTKAELYVGGMSLAKGYLNLDDITKKSFIQHPKYGRIYNTGDVVERLESGNIVYRGRRDNQTKINGYRIEMGEVEAGLNKLTMVKEAAAVAVDNTLYAFVTITDGSSLTLDEMKSGLKEGGLPFFAIPSRLNIVEKFPKTISGKLDRKVLKKEIEEANKKSSEGGDYDQGTVLGVLMAAFGEVLRTPVTPTDDFFELGGDSASAGQTVGLIRYKGEKIDLPTVSILDLYTHRTPKALEEHIIGMSESGSGKVDDIFRAKRMPIQDSPRPRLFSFISLLVGLFFMFVDGLEVFWYFIIIWGSEFAIPVTRESEVTIPPFTSIFDVTWKLFVVKLGFYIVWLILAFVIKWTVMGRYREGRWAKYGTMHLRHWIVVRVTSHLPWRIIGGTGISKLVMRGLGAKIGKGTFTFWEPAAGTPMSGYDLYEMEDYSSICQGAYCSPIFFTEDSMVCGRISLGRSSCLYPRSTVSGSLRLGEGAILDYLSNATDGAVIPDWERWTGSPARSAGAVEDQHDPPPDARTHTEVLVTLLQVFDVLFGYYLVLCISMVPRYGLLIYLSSRGHSIVSPALFVGNVILSIFFGSLALTFFSTGMVRAAQLVQPSRPGAYHLNSWTSLVLWHKLFWFKSPQLMLNNTRFLQWFAKACGMTMGKKSSISNVKGCIPDLVNIGKNSFLANPVFLGVPIVRNLMFHVGTVTIGDNVLVGNNACFPINSTIPSDTTVAVNTSAPPDGAEPGGVWVGNPPVKITENVLVPFTPGRRIDAIIMFISEVGIIFIPGTFWALTILSWLYLFVFLVYNLEIVGDNPIAHAAFGSALLVPLRACWAIMAGFTARIIQSGFTRTPVAKNVGYWNSLCYRWRIYNKLWAYFIIPMLLKDFSGCMWMNRLISLLTMAIIEEDVLIVHHGLFKDHDYVRVRKGATINESCILRTHTFEDWRLKFDFVDIGPNSVVHPNSTVMFGTETGTDCTVVSNSLVLKGDKLAPDTIVAGIPAIPVKNEVPDDAEQYPLAEVKSSKCFRYTLFGLVLAMIGMALGAGLGVALAPKGESSTETVPASEDISAYREKLAPVVGDSVMKWGTPESRAVEWIVFEDERQLPLDAPNLLQRYMLVVLYLRTTNQGMSPWAQCDFIPAVEDESCTFVDEGDVPQKAMRWLSSAHECEWGGVACADQEVFHIDLSTQGIDPETLEATLEEHPILEDLVYVPAVPDESSDAESDEGSHEQTGHEPDNVFYATSNSGGVRGGGVRGAKNT